MILSRKASLTGMISAQVRKRFANLVPSAASSLRGSHVSLLQLFSTAGESAVREKSGNTESIDLFLKENGFSDAQVDRVLKNRQQLNWASVEKSVKPKINLFQEFGFSKSEIAVIITKEPAILCSSARKRVYPSLCLLQSLVSSHGEAVKVLRRAGWFLIRDLTKTLSPNIEFLKSLGVSMQCIKRLLCISPTTLLMKPEALRNGVAKLETLGVGSSSKMFIYGLWAVLSMSEKVWELKLQAFRGLGFQEPEILAMFRKGPILFASSVEKVERSAKIILNRYSLSSIQKCPLSLSCSIERRLKPRVKVLEVLEKRNLIKKWPCLSVVSSYTDEKFRNKFIAPYPNVFTAKTLSSTGSKKKKAVKIVRRARKSAAASG